MIAKLALLFVLYLIAANRLTVYATLARGAQPNTGGALGTVPNVQPGGIPM